MADIGTAYVRIEPTAQGISGKIEKELGGVGASAGTSFNKGFGSVLGGVGKATLGIAAAGAAGLATLGAGVVSASKDVASYGDNIDKMSQKMGLTAEAYQEWDAVMQHSGTSMESMKSSMKTLANAAETGNKAFAELGITEKDLANMNQQELFEATIAGLQNVDDTTQRTYLAGKLLGKGATELGALLNTSAEDTQAMRDRVRELGGVMSDDAVKDAAAFQDQLQDMQTAFQGLSRNMVSEFLPDITQVMSGLTEIFSGNTEQGISQISEGIKNLADNLIQAIPQVASVAGEILSALGEAIITNLPMLMQCATDILMGLVNFIILNLPSLIEAGMQIILQLATSIAEALPELIPQIVDVILTIVQYLIENADLLIEGAIALIVGLAEGLINALPVLIEKLPQIIVAIVEALIRNAPVLLEAGLKLILMLAQGIAQAIPQVIAAAIQLFGSLKSTLISKAPEMLAQGKAIIQQFINGITQMIANAKQAMHSVIDGIRQKVSEWFESAKSWGKDLIQNFINGIKENISQVADAAKDIGKTVKQYIGFSEPELGPLSNFHTFAPDMCELFVSGLKANEGLIADQMAKTFALPSLDETVNTTMETAPYLPEDIDTSEKKVLDLLSEYIPIIAKTVGQPIEVIQDNKGMFEAVRGQNSKFITATGYHALA